MIVPFDSALFSFDAALVSFDGVTPSEATTGPLGSGWSARQLTPRWSTGAITRGA